MTFYSLHDCGVHKSNLVVTYICNISQYSVDLFIYLFIIIIIIIIIVVVVVVVVVTFIIIHLVRRRSGRYAISVISLLLSTINKLV